MPLNHSWWRDRGFILVPHSPGAAAAGCWSPPGETSGPEKADSWPTLVTCCHTVILSQPHFTLLKLSYCHSALSHAVKPSYSPILTKELTVTHTVILVILSSCPDTKWWFTLVLVTLMVFVGDMILWCASYPYLGSESPNSKLVWVQKVGNFILSD